MENKNLVWVLLILGLLVGGSFGAVFYSAVSPVKIVYEDRDVPGEEIEVPGETVYTNQTVEVPFADASLFLDEAIDEVFDELDDDDKFLTCGRHEFDDDEVSVSRVKEWSYSWLDDDEYEVSFEAKFKFEDDSEKRDCKETRSYSVFFEEGENPIVNRIAVTNSAN